LLKINYKFSQKINVVVVDEGVDGLTVMIGLIAVLLIIYDLT